MIELPPVVPESEIPVGDVVVAQPKSPPPQDFPAADTDDAPVKPERKPTGLSVGFGPVAGERPERAERAMERAERAERPERPERPERAERAERQPASSNGGGHPIGVTARPAVEIVGAAPGAAPGMHWGGGTSDRAPYGGGGGRPTSAISMGDIDKDLAGTQRLAEAIRELRTKDETYVSCMRVEPAFHPVSRKPIRGYKARFPVSEFRGAEDLIDRIAREYGGHKWDLRFSGPDARENGSLRFLKSVRIEIDAEPILEGANGQPGVQGAAGGPTIVTPQMPDVNSELVRGTLGMLTDHIRDMKKDQGGGKSEVLGIVRELSQMNGGNDAWKEALRAAEKRADEARKEISEIRTLMLQPTTSPEAVRAMSESTTTQVVAAHKDAETKVERARIEHEREMKTQADKHQTELKNLTDRYERDQREANTRHERELSMEKERHKSELDRVRDDVKDLTKRLEEVQRDARKEVDRASERLADAEKKAADERRTYQERIEDERRNTEKIRTNFDDRLKAEIAGVKAIYDGQITGLQERLKFAEQTATAQQTRWEERIRDLEKQRDHLQGQLMEERTRRPDPIGSATNLAAQAKDLATAFGYERPDRSSSSASSAPPARSEFAENIVAFKEAGIVDGIKDIGTTIAKAVVSTRHLSPQQPQAQQPPPWVIPVARDPVTGYPILPQGQVPPPPPHFAGPAQPAPHRHPTAAPPMQPYGPAPGSNPAFNPVQMYAPPQPQQMPPQAVAPPQQMAPTQQAPQGQPQAPQPAPGQEPNDAILQMVVEPLGQEFQAGKPPAEVAKAVLDLLPLGTVKEYLAGGVTKFMEKIAAINVDSPLLNAAGEKFLRGLFSELKAAIK